MRRLKALREEIDRIDEQVLRLIARRMRIVEEIAEIKRDMGLSIVDEEREKTLLAKLKKRGEELGIRPEDVELIFRLIMLMSIRRQVIGH
ncbi:MAG: chorismate mutase [Thermoprotei archaeon]|mgnify:CR=1 FL=1|nr:chorismate mutase [Thermoprotei archaeon]